MSVSVLLNPGLDLDAEGQPDRIEREHYKSVHDDVVENIATDVHLLLLGIFIGLERPQDDLVGEPTDLLVGTDLTGSDWAVHQHAGEAMGVGHGTEV
jgi:hypothetical protein